MLTSANSPRRVILSARRLILLATVAGLGAATLVAGAGDPNRGILPAVSTAPETAQRPVGFVMPIGNA